MNTTTETKYYSFDLSEIQLNNPDMIEKHWRSGKGVYYMIAGGKSCGCLVIGDRFLLPVKTVEEYAMIWDHVDLSRAIEYLMHEKLPEESKFRTKLSSPGGFASLTLMEFRQLLTEYTPYFYSIPGVKFIKSSIYDALDESYLFLWAQKNKVEVVSLTN